jgi:hypothetical protein
LVRASLQRNAAHGILILSTIASARFSASAQTVSANASNFNGTAIAGNNYLWFNSHLSSITFSGAASSSPLVHVYVTSASVTFTDATLGNTYNIALPNEVLTFDTAASSSSISYSSSKWNGTFPKSGGTSSAGNPFATGLMYQVPASGITGGINPVTLTASFSTDQSGVSLNWQWSAAVYTQTQANPNNLNVLAADGSGLQSGTPQSLVSFVIGGARGGGGANYTGSNSGTLSVTPAVLAFDPTAVPESSTWAAVGFLGVLAGTTAWRRQRA